MQEYVGKKNWDGDHIRDQSKDSKPGDKDSKPSDEFSDGDKSEKKDSRKLRPFVKGIWEPD